MYNLTAEQQLLRAKAKTLYKDNLINESEYARFMALCDKAYERLVRKLFKMSRDEYIRKFNNLTNNMYLVIWDIVKHAQFREYLEENASYGAHID